MPHVRLAGVRDLRALSALCRAAVGDDDYVLHYLADMVAAREILVTEHRGRIRAMTGVTECADRALWIGQLRSHPALRRRGYARLLLDAAHARVVRERRPALRLWTSERNVAARRLFETNGFRRVGMFSRMAAPSSAATSTRHLVRAVRSPDDLLRRWDRSVFGREGHAYLEYRWRFTRLDRRVVRLVARRDGFTATAGGTVLMWADNDDAASVRAAVLSGGKAALLLARRLAGARGFSRVLAFLPRTRRSLAVARQAGFRKASWGTRAILYERSREN